MDRRPPAEIGMRLENVETPALLLDLDAFERNLSTLADQVKEMGVRLRPHAKTHKSAVIGRRQMALGAVGVCCQKVSEAEAMVHGGVSDVYVSNEIVGAGKLARLAALAREARLAVCVDNSSHVNSLSAAARSYGVTMDVMVEINVGANRCGTDPGEPALALAQQVARAPGLRFRGLQGYQGAAQHIRPFHERRAAVAAAVEKAQSTKSLLARHGFECEEIAGAGTGTYPFEGRSGVYTELQAGYMMIDAPGFVDFLEESKIALLAADAAVVVIDADPNRIPQTRALIDFLESRRMPHLFFINKMDRPGANAIATLDALVNAYGIHVVAEQLPVGEGDSFTGVLDLVSAVPDGANVASAREKLLEALGDFDDHLMEELLEGVEPPLDEVRKDLHDEYARDQIVPVLFGSAVRGIGISELIATIAEQFPSPLDVERTDANGRPIEAKPGGPVVAQVCKTIIHPQSGKLSVVRVFSGTLTNDSVLTDTSRPGVQSRPGGIYRLQGKKQEPVTSAGPGEIVALSRLEGVQTLDTLTIGRLAYRDAGARSAGTRVRGRDLAARPARRSEALADARASDRRRSGVAPDAGRVHQRTRAVRLRRGARCGRRRTARAQVPCCGRDAGTANRVSRNDHATAPKCTRATSTRPAATGSSARCACASNRGSAVTA